MTKHICPNFEEIMTPILVKLWYKWAKEENYKEKGYELSGIGGATGELETVVKNMAHDFPDALSPLKNMIGQCDGSCTQDHCSVDQFIEWTQNLLKEIDKHPNWIRKNYIDYKNGEIVVWIAFKPEEALVGVNYYLGKPINEKLAKKQRAFEGLMSEMIWEFFSCLVLEQLSRNPNLSEEKK